MSWPNIGIQVVVSRIKEDSKEHRTDAEVMIRSIGSTVGHLKGGRLNLTSPTQRGTFVSKLEKKVPDIDWDQIMEQVYMAVTEKRRGSSEPVEISGDLLPPEGALERWLVRPIIETGNPTIIYGPGGVGKSMFCLYLAILASEGISSQGLQVENPCKVMYLDWETNFEEIRERIRIIRNGLDLPVSVPEQMMWYMRMEYGIEANMEKLKEKIESDNIELLVLDSLGYAASGELESSKSARDLFSNIRDLGVTTLCIHHLSKDSMSQGIGSVNRPFGSVYFENAARHSFELKKDQAEDSNFLEVAMFDRKANNVKKIAPIGWQFTFEAREDNEDIMDSVTFTRRDVMDTKLRDAMNIKSRIVRLLQEEGALDRQVIADRLSTPEKPVSANHVSKVLSENKDRFSNTNGLWDNINLGGDIGTSKRMNYGDI